MQELAVFPLDLVVFPGQTVPLVVFEARYKRLVQQVLALDEPRFVIARARREGGAPFEEVATVVHVVELAERPDGTFTLTGHGRERVKAAVARREDVPESDGATRPLYFTDEKPLPLRRGDPNEERSPPGTRSRRSGATPPPSSSATPPGWSTPTSPRTCCTRRRSSAPTCASSRRRARRCSTHPRWSSGSVGRSG
jgi:hypothetical protein